MTIACVPADITKLAVDAIVHAANSTLPGGGGADGAIHRKGRKSRPDECIAIRNRQGGRGENSRIYQKRLS